MGLMYAVWRFVCLFVVFQVSKPPKHMMKDYKHIHVLDWDEDYDDSDGGYSDYKGSDEEGRRNREEQLKEEANPDFSSGIH